MSYRSCQGVNLFDMVEIEGCKWSHTTSKRLAFPSRSGSTVFSHYSALHAEEIYQITERENVNIIDESVATLCARHFIIFAVPISYLKP